MNLPNKLTILRICMIPLFVIAYFLPLGYSSCIFAVLIFILAAFTDFLDGHIARKYNLVTDFGKLLDPVADKILTTASLFCLTATNPLQWISKVFSEYSTFDSNMFGIVFLTVCSCIILARELLIDGVRMIAASKGMVVQANIFGKIKTILQDISIPFLLILNIGEYLTQQNILYVIIWHSGVILFMGAVVMTIVSGIIYVVQNKSVFEDR